MAVTPSNPTVASVVPLLNKLRDPDPDFRFMSLNDLLGVLNSCRPEFLVNNPSFAVQCADAIISVVDDSNGEVQNLAIRWYGHSKMTLGASLLWLLVLTGVV